MRNTLQQKVKDEQTNLRVYLKELSDMYTKDINDSLRNIRQQMDEPMNTLKEYVAYVKGLKLSQDTLTELEAKKTKLEGMKQTL